MWLGIPGVEVVAVADPVAEGLARAGKRLPGTRMFADYGKMLSEIRPDIVSVSPRHVDQHAEMVIAASRAGARGIYVEKPFSRTPGEADAMIKACGESGTKLAVAHRMRYHPVLPVVEGLIARGLVGEVLEMRGRGKEDHRGGTLDLWVLGSHVFNLMNYFAGEAVSCSASVFSKGQPLKPGDLVEGAEGTGRSGGDEVHARYRMENGWTAYFDSRKDAGKPGAGFGLEIVGTDGTLNFRVDQEPLVYFRKGNPFDVSKKGGEWIPVSTGGVGVPEPIPELGKKVGSHFLAGTDLISAIREDRSPVCEGRQGRQVVEMVCGALASHRVSETVRLPLDERGAPFAGWGM